MKDHAATRRRENLKRLLKPRHIAFVGGKAVEDCINATRKSGFAGDIWVVHPTYDDLAGIPCVPGLADLPEPPDATLIAVSRARTIQVVAELSAMGAGGAVSIVGEFSEAGADGAALQAHLVEAAGDLALVGPNCLGLMNMFDGAAVWGGDNVFEPVTGEGVALISQSGYVAYSITNVEAGLPLGYSISIGNQAVLNVADFIDVVLDDPRVRAIGLYLEGIVDVAALSRAALRAIDKDVPIVALRAGGTEESAELTRSHSGTLAVANDMWSALFHRLGIVETGSPKALVETLKLLGSPKPPKGNRVIAGANSGGYAAMIGEKGRASGLAFPAPSDPQRQALRRDVPDLVSLSNPLDWNLPWASMARADTSDVGLGHLMTDQADVLVYFMDWPRQSDVARVWWPTLEGLMRLNARITQPVVVASVLPDGMPADLRRRLADAGVICLQGLDDAVSAIAAAGRYHTLRRAVLADRDNRELRAPPPEPGSVIQLDEAEGKSLLASWGLTIPRGATGSAGEVIGQAEAVGYPLAVKLLNAELAHKNHAGAVHLNIENRAALEDAIDAIGRSVRAYDADLSTERFLIERMVASPRAEFIVGVSCRPGLGHALVIGRGGTEVEEVQDYATLLLPAGRVQIDNALDTLKISRRLGLSDADRTALVGAIGAIAAFAEQHRGSLVELDVNPIILDAKGRATAADAFFRLARS
ncbi:MAG: acetate--CoA ligase family protein [Pseudomonadota bacterium]